MKYVIKADDGAYMRWPGGCGSSHAQENGWNSSLESADQFDSIEDANWRIKECGFGKWLKAKIVPITITECPPSFEDIIADTSFPLRICFDVDGVLTVIDGEYGNREPYLQTIEIIRKLKAAGHIICIQTARYMFKRNGSQEEADQYGRSELAAWLEKYNVPYDELYFGKVPADIYVDDRGCRVEAAKHMEDWENNFGPILEATKIKVSQLPTG
jgi:capsule biosynthesis phosphatase